MTSYDVIKRLKRLHPFKKIGYIGTLDRNATGILPVALNEGVKLIPFLENGQKRYVARFVLGITTDTLDMEGTRLSETTPPVYERGVLEGGFPGLRGRLRKRSPPIRRKRWMGSRSISMRGRVSPSTPSTKRWRCTTCSSQLRAPLRGR